MRAWVAVVVVLAACAAPRREPEVTRGPYGLVGRTYRLRYGVLRGLPGPDDAVDARTGANGFPAEGPFELAVVVQDDDVFVSRGKVFDRAVMCVDVRPPRVPGVAGSTRVLDVQPVDGAPAVPFAAGAVTGERLAIGIDDVMDEDNMPCDRREWTRRAWDDNLRRLQRDDRASVAWD